MQPNLPDRDDPEYRVVLQEISGEELWMVVAPGGCPLYAFADSRDALNEAHELNAPPLVLRRRRLRFDPSAYRDGFADTRCGDDAAPSLGGQGPEPRRNLLSTSPTRGSVPEARPATPMDSSQTRHHVA